MRFFRLTLAGIGIAAAGYLLWTPDPARLLKENPKTTALMELRDRQARGLGQKPARRWEWKTLSSISPNLVHAVLLAEDDTFYRHSGFDLEQIKIAVRINLKKRRFAYGGSTLTQQLARTLYLSPRKNLFRKAKEALITIRIERSLPKRRILELYLNTVEWGPGVYGAEAAARHHFGKSASELTAEEAVALASILPSPRKWSPLRTTPFMARRRGTLLNGMRREGWLPVPAQNPEEREEVLEKADEEEDRGAPDPAN
jgi:monofunctional biosynthetic peptidoglycan transglycosylase